MAEISGSATPLSPWRIARTDFRESGPSREPVPDPDRPIRGRRGVTSVRCRPSLLAAIADHPLRRTAAGGTTAIGAPPSNRAGGGHSLVTVHSLDWQKLPGYW
ncbi:hypothetical protein GCM10010383_03040 [Streptomyces lomondensis]|uniref:Uncharacterized protein n=1 Tax=Streptomyces lomondensis TaxID=68229 RepID=A0ABQ2WYD6_9ACTN|nr:hypothetical protein GCM10010383_03040 [Streptomyces lomondensis]